MTTVIIGVGHSNGTGLGDEPSPRAGDDISLLKSHGKSREGVYLKEKSDCYYSRMVLKMGGQR